jgi:hypothetical protein
MGFLSQNTIAAHGVLALLIYVIVAWWLDFSADAVSGVMGIILGAILMTSIQSYNAASERRNQMRLAAVDRRLDSYQQAFYLWRKLLANVHNTDQIGDVVVECQDWWDRNCLYLDPDARKAFNVAYMAAANHGLLLVEGRDEESAKLAQENWRDIIGAGEVIVKGAALPTIGEDEYKLVGAGKRDGGK